MAIATHATRTPPRTRYLEDVFMHARSRSRRVTAADEFEQYSRRTLDANTVFDLLDEIIAFENTVSDFLASIATAAVERTNQLEKLGSVWGGMNTTSLDPQQVDEFIRPLFEAAGILEDFIPWREAFPNWTDGGDDR